MGGLFVLSAIAIFSVTGVWPSVQCGDEPFTIEDFLTGRYSARGFSAQWVSDEDLQFRNSEGDVVVWNVATNKTQVAVSKSLLDQLKAESYSVSPDRQFVLVSYDTHAQFRHSTTARFKIAQLPEGATRDIADGELIQSASWGPTGSSLIYILDNNIFYIADANAEAVQITSSGIPGVIYNGVPDWVYEEEVLGSGTAYWFSPSGRWLIYLEFNDTAVPELTYQRYGTPGTLEDQYPEQVTIRYPKAGAVNPSYKAYLLDLSSTNFAPQVIAEQQQDSICYGYTWGGDDIFGGLSMSRVQNESWLTIMNVQMKTLQVHHFESPNGWIYTNSYKFDGLGQNALSIESWGAGDGSNFGNWSHLVIRNIQTGSARALTSGRITVLSIVGWDLENGVVYYTASEVGKPYVSLLYSVQTSSGKSICLSCTVISPEGNVCTSAAASFSSSFSYLVLTCSAPDPRIVTLYANNQDGSGLSAEVETLEDNSALREQLKTKAVPTYRDEVIGGAQVRLFLPANFNQSSSYPLLINVYGGPDSNQIAEGFSVNWGTYLTSSLGIIYGLIDGRGSGHAGDDNMFAGYRSLGTVEIIDQINVTSLLQERFGFIEKARTGIWGWSYGGYATGRTLELDTQGVFKCGISVAPVTSWLYYDSVYTERYMGLPTEEDNLSGYKSGDLVSNTSNLKTKQYYLIHGNADDNVHYQQSMLLSRALELDDVIFQQQSYPDENHSLGGVQRHLYHSMDLFWKNCFSISS